MEVVLTGCVVVGGSNSSQSVPPQHHHLRFPIDEGNPKGQQEALHLAEKMLMSKKMSQLIALLCHLLYWSLFGK